MNRIGVNGLHGLKRARREALGGNARIKIQSDSSFETVSLRNMKIEEESDGTRRFDKKK